MGAHLADSTAKDTGHVRATVFQTRVTSSKHVSQLATVHLLGLFSYHWWDSHFSDGQGWKEELPARWSGSPLHRAGRHTIPGQTRAFVQTAHNHAESLWENVHDGPGVQFGRWGQEEKAQGTAARSYSPLHATGLHILPWSACAWTGSYTSVPSRYLKTGPSSSYCCVAWAYCSSSNQVSATNLWAMSFPLFAARARCPCTLPCLLCVHVTYILTSECQQPWCVPVACYPCLVLLWLMFVPFQSTLLSLPLSLSLSLSRVLFFCLSASLVSFACESACVCWCAGVSECVCVFLSCL